MPENLVPIAMEIIKNALKESQEPGSYYDGWKANIACCIMDFFSNDEHERANKAAEAFLGLLIK